MLTGSSVGPGPRLTERDDMAEYKFVLIGGGSVKWAPHLATDLMFIPELSGSRLVLVDIDPDAAELVGRYLTRLAETIGTG